MVISNANPLVRDEALIVLGLTHHGEIWSDQEAEAEACLVVMEMVDVALEMSIGADIP